MKSSSWPSFAFEQDSPWGRCLLSFFTTLAAKTGSLGTMREYRYLLTAFFTSPAKVPDAYSREDVETFVRAPCWGNQHHGQMPAPGTMNNRLSAIASFYAYAASYSVTDANGAIKPILQSPPPTLGMRAVQRDKAYRSLSYEDFTRLMAVIPDTVLGLRNRAIYLTYFWTARRRSEIVGLRWGDIEQVVFADNGKPRQGYRYHFRGKGRQRIDDTAELPMPAYTAILAYIAASGRAATIQPGDPIFIADAHHPGRGGYDPHHAIDGHAVWRALKTYAAQAGIDPATITIHSFRHFAAQSRYQAGEDLLSISHLLRHADVGTTQIYLQGLITASDDGAAKLEEKFDKFSQS